MESSCAWIIGLLGFLLIGNAFAQGKCCIKDTLDEECDDENPYFPSYNIDDKLCDSLAQDTTFEMHVCHRYPDGYEVNCKQAITDNEFICTMKCPPPPGGTGSCQRRKGTGLVVIFGYLLIKLSRFMT